MRLQQNNWKMVKIGLERLLREITICRWLTLAIVIAWWSVSAWDGTMRNRRHDLHAFGYERWMIRRFICYSIETLQYDGVLSTCRNKNNNKESISAPYLWIFGKQKQEALTCRENWVKTKLGCKSFGRWISPSRRRLYWSFGEPSREGHQTAEDTSVVTCWEEEGTWPPFIGIGWVP